MRAPGAPSPPPSSPSTPSPSLALLRRQLELQAPPAVELPPHPPPSSSLLRRRRPRHRHRQLTAHLVRTSPSPKPYRSAAASYNRRLRRLPRSPPVFPCRRVNENVSTLFASLPSSCWYPHRRPPLSQSPASHWAPSAAARVLTWLLGWRHLSATSPPRQPFCARGCPVNPPAWHSHPHPVPKPV